MPADVAPSPLMISGRSLIIIVVATVVSLWVSLTYGRLNVSPSLHLGFYRVHRVPDVLTRGTLVVVAVPPPWREVAVRRGWVTASIWEHHATLLKPVAAVAGDLVCRLEGVLVVDGRSFGVFVDESHGEPLTSALTDGKCLAIPPGYVFLASPVEKSFDSRYMGPFQISDIAAVVTPLWTW
jgi:conjugative transfer signal peptidase TraF